MLAMKQRLLQLDEALKALELAADTKKSIPVFRVVNVSMIIVAAACLL